MGVSAPRLAYTLAPRALVCPLGSSTSPWGSPNQTAVALYVLEVLPPCH
jgi:hypothetical protein